MANAQQPQALIRSIRSIPEPRHYYTGIEPELNELPRNVLLFPRLSRAYMDRHHTQLTAHHRYLLVVVLQTEGTVQLEHLSLRMSPGTAVLVHPFQLHRVVRFASERMAWLNITFELKDALALSKLRDTPVVVPAAAWEPLAGLVDDYVRHRDKSPTLRTRIALRLAMVFNELTAAAPVTPHRLRVSLPGDAADEAVERACRFIGEQLSRGIGIREVAAHTHLSESHLRAIFRRALGASLGQYIRGLRMYRAAQLAALSELDVSEIAQRCGFDSIYSFSRAFKRELGVSPTHYRRRYAPSARAGRSTRR